MKTLVLDSGLVFLVSAFVIPLFILVRGWKKFGSAELEGCVSVASALWIGVGLLVCGLILLLVAIFLKG